MLSPVLQLYRNSFSGLRREVWYLAAVLLINRSGAMVLPFLTVYLTAQRGYTLGEAGLVMSAFGLGSLVGSYVGGWLTDRIGFYGIQQLALVSSGFMFFALGQAESLWPMCILTFLVSVTADAFRPANQAAVAYYSRPENLSRSYGLLRLAVNLGFSLGPVLGGLLIAGVGYKWLFIVDGLTCLLAALAFRLMLPPGRQRAGEDNESLTQDGRSAYRDYRYLLFVLSVVLFATAFMQFFSSLPVYLQQQLGYGEGQIGQLIALNGIVVVLFEMPLVQLAGNRYRIMPIIAVGVVLIGISYLLLTLMGSWFAMAIMFIILISFGEVLSMPFASTFAAARAPVRRRGQYMGLLSIAYAIAFIAAPSIGLQWAEHFGFDSLWWLVAGLAFASGGLLFWLYLNGEGRMVPGEEDDNTRRRTDTNRPQPQTAAAVATDHAH